MTATLSPSPTRASRLVFSGKQQVQLEPFEILNPGPEEVRVETRFSLMSTGTENIVFNRQFDAGTHWDQWVKYPFYPGYSAVGMVEAVGAKVADLRPGDRVAIRRGHASHAVLSAAECIKIPEAIPLESAPWFSLAKIAFHGAWSAQYHLGDSVLIIGAGPIGQMSIRWAYAAGVMSIIAVDALPARLTLAEKGGATTCISAPIRDARDQILKANDGRLPRVVIDSTGNPAVFNSALGLAANFGRVVVLGDTGQPAQQSLTSDLIIRGLTVVGAHDGHNTAEWNDTTITKLFFNLAASGRFSLEGLNSHFFKPAKCAEAYDAANRERAKTMGIIFDWTHNGKNGQ